MKILFYLWVKMIKWHLDFSDYTLEIGIHCSDFVIRKNTKIQTYQCM